MPKSEFDPVQKIVKGVLEVTGPFKSMLDERDEGPTTERLVWMIEQDGQGVTGTTQPAGKAWWDTATPPEGWSDGPALATAAVVKLTAAGVETFSWWCEVTLERA